MPNIERNRPRDSEYVGETATEPSAEFSDWLTHNRLLVEEAISVQLNELEMVMGPHSRLLAAVQYSVKIGGKRLRPILVLESCRVCGGRPETAMPAALAVELVHTFSLIHDDLPAMDNDDLRRGHPTSHKVFGEAIAVLTGDWLMAHAFSLLGSEQYDREVMPALLAALADGTKWMIEGQAADIDGQARPPDGDLVAYIHDHKTAALIATCCRLGALCAGPSVQAVTALGHYGRHLGLAFQIVDDLLDATGSAERMGKRVAKDAAAAKQTYPAVFGIEASRARAEQEIEVALKSLEPFGPRADRLRDLAYYVVHRDR